MKILFICTGNTCRSPMAEALFNADLSASVDIQASSAGLSAFPHDSVTPEAVAAMKKYGIDLGGRTAVRFDEEMAREADLILTMTSFQREMLLALFPDLGDKIFSFSSFLNEQTAWPTVAVSPGGAGAAFSSEATAEPVFFAEVEDPYGQSQLIYDRVAGQLADMVSALQKRLDQKVDSEQSSGEKRRV